MPYTSHCRCPTHLLAKPLIIIIHVTPLHLLQLSLQRIDLTLVLFDQEIIADQFVDRHLVAHVGCTCREPQGERSLFCLVSREGDGGDDGGARVAAQGWLQDAG